MFRGHVTTRRMTQGSLPLCFLQLSARNRQPEPESTETLFHLHSLQFLLNSAPSRADEMENVYLLTGVCLALFCFQALRTRFWSSLRTVPGPSLASISNIWKIYQVYKKNAHRSMIAVHERYGPVVLIGPNTVSFASPEALYIIHGSRNAYPKVLS